jgi:hypothetical protein
MGIVHDMPNAVDDPFTASLLPNVHGRIRDNAPTFLDVPWLSKSLFPGIIRTDHEDGQHVPKHRLTRLPAQHLYGKEKIGHAEEIVRRILFHRRGYESGMQFTTKNARGRVDGRDVHRVGLPLVLGLKTSVPPDFLPPSRTNITLGSTNLKRAAITRTR